VFILRLAIDRPDHHAEQRLTHLAAGDL
jgi:hypothetical protein